MEIFPIYEVTIQLLWCTQDLIYANNKKTDQLSQGVEPRKYQIIMIDTNCEDVNIRTHVNLSALWTMDPMMATQLRRDELEDK